jgi:hypothetical protein
MWWSVLDVSGNGRRHLLQIRLSRSVYDGKGAAEMIGDKARANHSSHSPAADSRSSRQSRTTTPAAWP